MSDLHPAKVLRDRLRAAGLRATAARVSVLRTLLEAQGPMSHAEVYDQVDQDGFDRATVYRNLVDLAEARLLKRADVGDHVWRFEVLGEGADADQGHPHFVCSDCGTVECLPTDAVSLNKVPGTATEPLEVHVRGVCDDCG